jgi:hypothetical protein
MTSFRRSRVYTTISVVRLVNKVLEALRESGLFYELVAPKKKRIIIEMPRSIDCLIVFFTSSTLMSCSVSDTALKGLFDRFTATRTGKRKSKDDSNFFKHRCVAL